MSQLRKRERGSALILVIGVLVLLSIIGTTFVALMRIERTAARNFSTDVTLRQLALQALAFCMEHPNWDPNEGATDFHIDNDNIGGNDSIFITQPLSGTVTSDIHARWAILKKSFGGRLNVNWNSFFIDRTTFNEYHALNEGASPGEVSLVDPIAAYLDYMGTPPPDGLGLPVVGSSAQNRSVAEEIARRICNYRYGLLPLGASGTSANATPGEDGWDDDDWLNDSTLGLEDPPAPPPPPGSAPPARNDKDDDDRWAGPLDGINYALNWRPVTHLDRVDNNGDGVADEPGEQIDDPWEYDQYRQAFDPLDAWPDNDDQPYGNADLTDIVTGTGAGDLRIIINDVCQFWAPGQGYPFDGSGLTNYFEYLRVLFTTENRDYVGGMAPLNHLNILMPGTPTPEEIILVETDRARFVSALAGVFQEGGMDLEPASLVAWQVLANLIDFLDSDPDPAGSLGDLGLLTALAKPEGWDVDNDDDNANGIPDPGEPNTRTFLGTERQPYINEIWVYNRTDDNFDNDHDTFDDDDNPLAHPLPLEDPGSGDTRNGYFIELHNHYATDIVLYNKPDDPTAEPTVDWYLRILNNADPPAIVATYRFSAGQLGEAGAGWEAAGSAPIVVPAGGYLIVESRDWAIEPTFVPGESENDWLGTSGFRKLPDPAEAGTMPAGVPIVNLGLAETIKLFDEDYTIELVYSYDEDGSDGDKPLIEAVVDRQKVPANAISIEGGTNDGARDFAPSWERHDPRLARAIRVPAPAGASNVGDVMLPTWGYRDAENTAAGTGGDYIRHTLGEVNAFDTDGDGEIDLTGGALGTGEVFDGNYDLGESTSGGYDDLVDVPNSFTWKFANPGALGKLLCVGPTPTSESETVDYGWSDNYAAVDPGEDDYWLIVSSPYTQVPIYDPSPTTVQDNPLDAKKINFTELDVYDWNSGPPMLEPEGAPGNFPTGRAAAVFDKFTTIAPWLDGKDNDGDWNAANDETDVTDTDGDGFDDPAPTPGDGHVDEGDEVYVPGRIDVNNSSAFVLSGLPYVKYDDSTFERGGASDITGVFLTADVIAGAAPFENRADFLRRVVRDAVNDAAYNPPGGVGAFGRDTEDNHRCGYADGPRRSSPNRDYQWETLQQPPRTNNASLISHDFSLPGADASNEGGDRLIDDKTEVDYTVGALMNMVGLDMELPSEFAGGGEVGVYTYFITVQITDGLDVNGDGVSVGDDDVPPDGIGITEPDWKEGAVLAEKRIIVLVNTALPITDPSRVRVFNWAVEGRAPER